MKPCLRVQFSPRPVLVLGTDLPSLVDVGRVHYRRRFGRPGSRVGNGVRINVFARDPARAIDRSVTVASSADGWVVYAADVADGTVRSRSGGALQSVFEMKHDPPQLANPRVVIEIGGHEHGPVVGGWVDW